MRKLTLAAIASLVALLLIVSGAFAAGDGQDSPAAEPLTVSKDASGEYDVTYVWTIAKDVDRTLVGQIGGTATFTYTVSVSHDDGQVDEVQVSGTITVSNPNSTDVTLDGITDEVDGTPCSVDMPGGLVVGPGDTAFSYDCSLGDSLPSGEVFNQVTVDWSEQTLSDGTYLAAGSAQFTTEAAISFTANEADTCVFVSDPHDPGYDPDSPHVFCLGDEGDPNFSFQYSWAVDVPEWNCVDYENTATFESSDNQRVGSASQTVTACGPARTGALGKGFWQGRNGQAIIRAGSSTAGVCNSGPWLRQYNPFRDLSATATCSQVATYVTNVIKGANAGGASMGPMLKAQMLATALDVYFSDPALGGNMVSAPTPIGGVDVYLALICTDASCSAFEDLSTVFPGTPDGKESVLQLLADASNASTSGGSMWYGNVRSTQELAKDAFEALNSERVFDP